MKQQDALTILSEIERDRRLTATLGTCRRRKDGNGYTVKVSLRGLRVLTAGTVDQWASIKEAWKGL